MSSCFDLGGFFKARRNAKLESNYNYIPVMTVLDVDKQADEASNLNYNQETSRLQYSTSGTTLSVTTM